MGDEDDTNGNIAGEGARGGEGWSLDRSVVSNGSSRRLRSVL